jgi:aryl-alcohol dehydrogenase-like predicted oxidoreductase
MEYRNLGNGGLKVSELCLGSMQFGWTADEETSHAILNRAFDAGLNFIDTANIYSRWVDGNPGGVSERIIGNWLKDTRISRDRIVLATKVRGSMGDGPNDSGLSRVHLINALNDSLRRLGTDYIDLYQVHWYDEATPLEETLATFDDMIHQGKVRYIGCSNHPAWRLTEALWTSKYHHYAGYASLQPHYNLVHREEFERELAQVCKRYGLGVIPYSPLAKGFLTGKYRRDLKDIESARASGARRYFSERNWALLELMEDISAREGKTISQIALAWLNSKPLVTAPIIGPRTLDQLDDNLGAVGLKLTFEEMEQLDQASDWNS